MKRLHIHTHVDDLAASVVFYSRLFGAEPTRVESGYAKWMLDDPRVNFAISAGHGRTGVDHLGIQVDTDAELAELEARAQAAEAAGATVFAEGETTCCYARSRKHWVTDPQGVAWEHFRTLSDIPVFREAPGKLPTVDTPAGTPAGTATAAGACCGGGGAAADAAAMPAVTAEKPVAATASCCGR